MTDGSKDPNLDQVYMTIPSSHRRYWTQEFLNEHLELVKSTNSLDREKSKALHDAHRIHFLDFKIHSRGEDSLVLQREPLPKGGMVSLGRLLLYAMFLGLYVLIDPYLKKPRLLKVKLVVNDQLETSVYALDWE